jgi:hypothetical protein
MTEGQPWVFEEMIQARSKFSGVALILVNVVADHTVLAKKIAADDNGRRFPRRSFYICS